MQLDAAATAAIALTRAQATQIYAGLELWPAAVTARLVEAQLAQDATSVAQHINEDPNPTSEEEQEELEEHLKEREDPLKRFRFGLDPSGIVRIRMMPGSGKPTSDADRRGPGRQHRARSAHRRSPPAFDAAK